MVNSFMCEFTMNAAMLFDWKTWASASHNNCHYRQCSYWNFCWCVCFIEKRFSIYYSPNMLFPPPTLLRSFPTSSTPWASEAALSLFIKKNQTSRQKRNRQIKTINIHIHSKSIKTEAKIYKQNIIRQKIFKVNNLSQKYLWVHCFLANIY